MPFHDAAMSYTPAPGTGQAASAALVPVSEALLNAMNPPVGYGYTTTGHVAIELAKGQGIDINFTKHAAQTLSKKRFAEVLPLLKITTLEGVNKAKLKRFGDVPLDTDLHAAATFVKADGTDAKIPAAARRWYTRALAPISNAHLDIAIDILENSTYIDCIPLALLKERKGIGRAIVGMLGFRHPKGGPVTDWEGGEKIIWI